MKVSWAEGAEPRGSAINLENLAEGKGKVSYLPLYAAGGKVGKIEKLQTAAQF
jgi:hypothetical protein